MADSWYPIWDRQHQGCSQFRVLMSPPTAIMGIILACLRFPEYCSAFAGSLPIEPTKAADRFRPVKGHSLWAWGSIFHKFHSAYLSLCLAHQLFRCFYACHQRLCPTLCKDNLSRPIRPGVSPNRLVLVGNSFEACSMPCWQGLYSFVINGVCFIYSAITEVFIRIPYKNEPLNPGISVRK